MDKVILHAFIKSFFINVYIIIINFKITNTKVKKYVIKIIFVSLVLSFCNIWINKYNISNLKLIINFCIQMIFIKLYIKNCNSIFICNCISNAIVYIIFFISAIIEMIFIYITKNKDTTINLIIIMILEIIILLGLFNIKRLKNGFIFLQKTKNNDLIEVILINVSIFVIIIYSLFGLSNMNLKERNLICFLFLGLVMLILIPKTLTLYYKQKLMVRNIEDYKLEIAEKDEKIKELSEEKYKISKLNHEFNHRQNALENKIKDFVNKNNIAIGSELEVISDIEKLSKEYSNRLEDIKNIDKLPLTQIKQIDDMFKYMQSECIKNNINFELKVNGNIFHMINNLITEERLVTLIADHIKDAIIAINASDNKFRSIISFIGKKNEIYEFSVYDSGIEFEIETLVNLGLKPITTHKEEGGSGLGFMTTFETMNETKASLIIEEKHKMINSDFTKGVTIKFDSKNSYSIKSYRFKELKEKIKSKRISINDLE